MQRVPTPIALPLKSEPLVALVERMLTLRAQALPIFDCSAEGLAEAYHSTFEYPKVRPNEASDLQVLTARSYTP